MQLGVGGVTEQMTVTAESPLLETSNADRGTVIDSHRIAELPLQSRSPMALAVLVAGVNYNAQAIYLRPFDNGALADFSMNGGQNRNNEFTLDGAPNNANQGGNNVAYIPPADAVQEFKVQTNSYDAQYGRTAGGVVSMSLKSGTNNFHGTGYEFYRRKWLDANSFLLNSRNTPKTEHYLDQYGFEVDGPVQIPGLYNGKGKTFFMFTGEKYREGTPAAQFSSVPTAAMKTGDFSKLVDAAGKPIIIYDPATGRDVNGLWTRDPFPGNQIPANRINATAKGMLQYFPDPELHDAGAAPTGSRTSATTSTSTRTSSGTGSARSTRTSAARTAPSSAGPRTSATRCATPPRSAAARRRTASCRCSAPTTRSSATGCTSSAAARSSTSAAATPTTSRAANPTHAFGFDATQFGWPASRGLAAAGGVGRRHVPASSPTISSSSLSRGFGPNTNKIFSIQPNISVTRGAHNIRSGLDWRRTNVYNDNYGNAGGQVDFNRSLHAQHDQQHQHARGECVRVVPARRAERAATCRSTCSRTTTGTSPRPGSRTTGASPTS